MSITTTGFQGPATSRVGNAPSVLNSVIVVGAEETPILSKIGSSKTVTNVLHSWIFDSFPEPRRKPRLEVDSIGAAPKSTKQKLLNAVEIFERSFSVSWDQQATRTYGAPDMTTEARKAAVGHALDMELAIVGLGRDSDAKTSIFKDYLQRDEITPGEMAGIFHYLTLNESTFAAVGDVGVKGNILAFDSAKDGTGAATALTWIKVKRVLRQIWQNGTLAKDIFLGPDLKDRLDDLVSRQYKDDRSITDNVTTLNTPYGTVNFNLHRFFTEEHGLADVLLAGNFEYARMGELESRIESMAKTHTADNKMYYTSATLEVRNAYAFSAAIGLK